MEGASFTRSDAPVVYSVMSSILAVILLVSLSSPSIYAQRPMFALGAGYGGAFGINESVEHPVGEHLRFTLLYLNGLSPTLSLELGGGHTSLSSGALETVSRYATSIVPLDIRLRYSLLKKREWSPFLFGGLGIALFEVTEAPQNKDPSADTAGGNLFVTGGFGLFHQFEANWAFDLTVGASTTFEDDLNPAHDKQYDGWWYGLIGIHYLFNNAGADTDNDGLSDADEQVKYKTDIRNPDSDGDGLSDGEEILDFNTDPLNRDTDFDEATDGQEARVIKTNPNNRDTDGDTLTDGAEFNTHKTNPLNRDTDGDGLTDNDEINKYHTKPYAIDTDGDSLNDGSEINRFHLDPLSRDTDKGGVNDGAEISRGTNPLDPADDKK